MLKVLPMPDYRRKLPHFHPTGKSLFVTWRLWGSMPGKRSGPLWLNDPRLADLVAHAIVIGECERHFYELHAWAVMPNHVHLLILPLVPVPVLMRWLKGSTGRRANLIFRTGGFCGGMALVERRMAGGTACPTKTIDKFSLSGHA